MPKFTVGIHDNVVVNKALLNDKGQLVIGIKEVGEIDPVAAMNGSGSTSFDSKEQDFIPYDIKVINFNKVGTPKEMMMAIADYKDPLDHLLSLYLTLDKRKWDVVKGIDVSSKALWEAALVDQTKVSQMQKNINDQFIAMITPFVGESGKKARVLFVRQSIAKHWPTFRKKYLDTNPFIEPMDVPVSKLKFTKYEIDKGLNNPHPAGGAATVNTAEASQASALFAN